MMPKVIGKQGRVFEVYGTISSSANLFFLIWSGKWEWIKVDNFVPYTGGTTELYGDGELITTFPAEEGK